MATGPLNAAHSGSDPSAPRAYLDAIKRAIIGLSNEDLQELVEWAAARIREPADAPPDASGPTSDPEQPTEIRTAWDERERTGTCTGLSEREYAVIRLCALGYTSKEIACHLGVSPKTVETHKMRAWQKLGIENRVEMVRYAMSQGWMTADEDFV